MFHEEEFELYNLDEDPTEENNLYIEYPEVAEELQELLEQEMANYSPPSGAEEAPNHVVDDAMKEHMRDLGYI